MSAALIAVVPPWPKALGVALVIAALGAALTPVAVAETEVPPCPNEQLREESNVNPATAQPYSTQLPDCRAYELVSPANSGGWEVPASSEVLGLSRGLIVTASGAVVYASAATPLETGAIEDGHFLDVFRSLRSRTGWTTRDLTPFGPSAGTNALISASTDGSAVLVDTPISLSTEDVDNPEQNVTGGFDLYVVREEHLPELVTHGGIPHTSTGSLGSRIATARPPFFWNGDLTAVGFVSETALSVEAGGVERSCYVWQNAGTRLAHLTNPEGMGSPPPVNCEYFAVTADGRAIFEDTSADGDDGLIFASGNGLTNATQLSGDTPHAATFAALSPDGGTVYLSTTDKLAAPEGENDAGTDLYAVNLQLTASASGPPRPPAVTCISCEAGGVPNVGTVTWLGQSTDGSHVFFATTDGTVYGHSPGGTAEIAPATDGLTRLVYSTNGEHVVAETNTGTQEFTPGQTPQHILGCGLPVAVSNSGLRIICDGMSSGREVITEWMAGETGAISPIGSSDSYQTVAVAGAELGDVFLEAHQPLVGQDENAGTTDLYDARVNGGFPAPTEHTTNDVTPNPTPPTTSPYTGNLAPSSFNLPALSADTSIYSSAVKPKALTRVRQLAKAVKACKQGRSKSKRKACERSARRKYTLKKAKRK